MLGKALSLFFILAIAAIIFIADCSIINVEFQRVSQSNGGIKGLIDSYSQHSKNI
ncbi:12431_t:CDS:1, partial [Cetraspora pellucida]